MYTAVHIVPIVQEDFLHEDNYRTGSNGPFATLTFPLKTVFKLCQRLREATWLTMCSILNRLFLTKDLTWKEVV